MPAVPTGREIQPMVDISKGWQGHEARRYEMVQFPWRQNHIVGDQEFHFGKEVL